MFKNKILVVDDELGIRETFNQILQDKYIVDLACSGEEAVKKAKKEVPDLVLLDNILPGMNGPDVLKEIHRINRYTPVIMVTNIDSAQVAVELMKLGAYDYINKPFNTNQVLDLIGKALTEREQGREKSLQVTTFFDLISKMAPGANPRSLLNRLMDVSIQLLTADSGSIMLVDNKRISIEVTKGLDNETIKTVLKKTEREIIDRVVKEKNPLLLVNEFSRKMRFSRFGGQEEIKSSLYVPLKIEDKVIGVLNLNRTTLGGNFTEDDLQLATALTNQVAIIIENSRLQKDREEVVLEAIMSLAEAVDANDHYTHAHSEKVMKYALLIAEEMDLSEKEKSNIKQAALLHDIGKIGINNSILNKAGKLTPKEWKEIKMHPLIGRDILKPLRMLEDILLTVYHHHERYDGRGYLDKLKGKQIPIGARILALADTFDAMSSARPYRNACPLPEIIAEIKKGAKTQFDPEVVKAFLSILNTKSGLWLQIMANSKKP
ncbi:MAG: response regulator [Nitrospirae bacterium]|nr:response regulator [Nitrospirota bacterium]